MVSLEPAALTSEFEVRVGAVPFLSDLTPFGYSGGLPLAIEGSIVSTASIEDVDAGAWSLFMDTVEVKGSNVPGLRQLLDGGLKLDTRVLGGKLVLFFNSPTHPIFPICRTPFPPYVRN